jgi:hypothetical protein
MHLEKLVFTSLIHISHGVPVNQSSPTMAAKLRNKLRRSFVLISGLTRQISILFTYKAAIQRCLHCAPFLPPLLRLLGEEYLDSEKYEIKVRDWDGATKKGLTLAPFITQLNAIRKANPALQQLRNLVFHNTESEAIIAYSKREGKNLILVVVNLDPSFAQGTIVHWDMNALGLEGSFAVKDLLDGKSFDWSEHQFVQLDPTRPVGKVAHICQVKL